MSRQINEAQEGRAINVVDAAAGDATPAVTEISATGKRGIPVLIAPFHSQSDGRAGGATAQDMRMAFQGFLLLEEKDDDDPVLQRKKWFKEMRGWLMVLATVAASVTYQAGLNPPGGFWQDDPKDHSHHAGDPALHEEHRSRYLAFFYFNATAFVTSLVIMVLLMSERFYHTEAKVLALMLTTFVDLASLVGAYIAGTTRYFSSCIYVIVIVCVAFVGVIYIGEVMADMCTFFLRKMPCMLKLAKRKWFPVPAELVDNAMQQQREAEVRITQMTTTERSKQRAAGCSPCCPPRTQV
uniref:PGG domain-containing protein n=1 Tax=Arundo donax TaxID=35708 RepID=A0A0A9D619_ARUDO